MKYRIVRRAEEDFTWFAPQIKRSIFHRWEYFEWIGVIDKTPMWFADTSMPKQKIMEFCKRFLYKYKEPHIIDSKFI